MKKAILLGATGLTGGFVLRKLLKDERYEKIILFSRNSVELEDKKIEENLTDLFELKEQRNKFHADEVFCCVGTTSQKSKDRENYRKVDYGIPVSAAELCKENNISTFLVISAMGASPGSNIFYPRTKGEMERDVLAQNLEDLYILRPSLIKGEREEKNTLEEISRGFMKIVDPVLKGSFKKYRSIDAETIAEAMIVLANEGYPKTVIESDEIKKIATHQ